MNKNLKFILTEVQFSLSKELIKLEITYPVFEVIQNMFIDVFIDIFNDSYKSIKNKPYSYTIALKIYNQLFDIVDYILDNSNKLDYSLIFDIYIKEIISIMKYLEKFEYYEACANIKNINNELINILEIHKIMISTKYS